METLFWIGVIIYAFWRYDQYKKENNPENIISSLNEQAEFFKNQCLKDSSEVPPEERRQAARIDSWYVQLKEREKHSMPKQLEIARDYKDFYERLFERETARKIAMIDGDRDAMAEGRRLRIVINEIQRRFAQSLGINYDEILKADELEEKN